VAAAPDDVSSTVPGVLQLIGVLRYRTDLDWSRAAAVVYVCFLATILLLGDTAGGRPSAWIRRTS
jgi:hypothetical protein